MTAIASPDLRLGYLVFEASRPKRRADFCRHTLGLPAPLIRHLLARKLSFKRMPQPAAREQRT